LDWKYSKQKRIAQSPGAAEVIAAHTGVYRGLVLRDSLESVTRRIIPLDNIVDSLAMYRSLVTSHDPQDLSMRRDITGLRDLYGSEVVHTMRWLKETLNPSDTLTKPFTTTTREVLNTMLNDSFLRLQLFAGLSQNEHQSNLPPVAN
jgi:hypothetical protein